MSLHVRLRPEAETDVDEALTWYAEQEPQSSGRFLAAIRQATERLSEHPELGQVVQGDARRVLVDEFPYSIMYRVRDETIVVLGCFHFRLDPKRWHDRL